MSCSDHLEDSQILGPNADGAILASTDDVVIITLHGVNGFVMDL